MTHTLPIIDSHCHLDFPVFDHNREQLIAQCSQAGMKAIIVPGVVQPTWSNIQALCKDTPLLYPAYGLHPCFMEQHSQHHLPLLDAQLEQGALAVGEIGLDIFHHSENLEQQLALFRGQLVIAQNHGLPVIIHCRKAHDVMLKTLREVSFKAGGIMHAFSGSLQQAERFIELGFKLGFGGAATYERAQKLRKILMAVPDSAIVLETDSPDIPPAFARNQPNSPYNLFRITDILAQVKGCEPATLARLSTQNVSQILDLPS